MNGGEVSPIRLDGDVALQRLGNLVQHLVAGGEGAMSAVAAAPRPGRLGVSFRPSLGTVKVATLIDPMQPGCACPLALQAEQGGIRTVIPQMSSRWVMIVWEIGQD